MNLAVVGENIISYEYDHFGIRTAKNVNGCRTELVNDGDSVIAELCQGEVTNYYRGLSLIGYEDSNNLYYYRLNAHGDTIGIVDGFGNQVKTYTYDAFGNQACVDKFDTNPFRYCGEYFDNETELIYLRARYYDPSIQRFVSEDPICDGVNWYVYCGNNPIKFIDSSGNTIALPIIYGAIEYVAPYVIYGTAFIFSVVIGIDIGIHINQGEHRNSGTVSLPDSGYLEKDVTSLPDTHIDESVLVSPITSNAPHLVTNNDYEDAKEKGNPAPNHSSTDNESDYDTVGDPNSSKDLTQNGELKRRRYYGPDGKAEKDIDYKHPGSKHTFPHEHTWEWESGTPTRIP